MILPSHLVIMVISYPIFFLTNFGFKSAQIKQQPTEGTQNTNINGTDFDGTDENVMQHVYIEN